MRLKELKKTVNVCWSPADQHPVTLVAGSAAQQVDASFSSTSHLELYDLNLNDPGLDLELKCSLQTKHKFQKVVWSSTGVIVGGCDGGLLEFYSADKLQKKSQDALIGTTTKHTGHVSALDINPYQNNLLASGASESEIFIWDLNNTSQPMAPGNKSQPFDHVESLAWNQQVQHILGSTFATRYVVWDLRKNEPIMKLSDATSRTRWRSAAWHPRIGTQLCIASHDDQAPIIQIWDLRLAASPLATLEGHSKGVLSVSWCTQDAGLLLSAGKDGKVLCWNPDSAQPCGEISCELSQESGWVFDAAFCPRDPNLVVTSSFSQQTSVHTVVGGSKPSVATNQSNIIDSFGGEDSFSQLPAVAEVPAQLNAACPQPKMAPNWMKPPTRAKFAFGGKLVTFEKCPQEPGNRKLVQISQLISEPEIVEKAAELDVVLGASLAQDQQAIERLAEYCRQRGDNATEQHDRFVWFFLRANFLPNFRNEVLNLLGFKQDDLASKLKTSNSGFGENPPQPADFAALSRGESIETDAELSTDTSTDLSDAHTFIERKLANLDVNKPASNIAIPNGEDSTSLICRALVCGNFEEAVELCLEAKRTADALIIASMKSQDLLLKVQRYHLLSTSSDAISTVLGSVLTTSWDSFVATVEANSWRHALAALLTHTEGDMLSMCCEALGDRLSKDSDPTLCEAATLCYVCAAKPDVLVRQWRKQRKVEGVSELTTLTAIAVLGKAVANVRGRGLQSTDKVDAVLEEYGSRLAMQGCLQSALAFLQSSNVSPLRERLQGALGIGQVNRPVVQPQHTNRAKNISAQSQNRSHLLGHNNVPNAYGAAQPNFEQPWQNTSVAAFPPQQLPPPLSGLNQHAGIGQASAPPNIAQNSVPAPAFNSQPPRPGSVGPQGGSVTTSRSKYKVDPSVQSAPNYNQYNYNNTVTSQPSYGYNSPLPDPYNPNSNFTPINQSMSQNPMNPALNPMNPVQNPMNPVQNPMNPNQNQMSSLPNQMINGYYNPQQAPIEQAIPTAVQAKQAAPGWNDPPMMSSKPKFQFDHTDMSALHAGTRKWGHIIEHRRHIDEPKQEMQAQAPITHPLFGTEPPQHIPLQPAQGQPQMYAQQGPMYQQQGQMYQQPGQNYQQQGQYTDQYQGQYAQVPQQGFTQQQAEPPAPAAPVEKAPIPEQHTVIKTVFDTIRNECSNRASNQQMKRKLEDVQRRLETLYDLLREFRLSEQAIVSLHNCVQYAQNGDYVSATQIATELATGADFATIAGFLPGLKVLFQLAGQLQVVVR